jgi:hypothetical protein
MNQVLTVHSNLHNEKRLLYRCDPKYSGLRWLQGQPLAIAERVSAVSSGCWVPVNSHHLDGGSDFSLYSRL